MLKNTEPIRKNRRSLYDQTIDALMNLILDNDLKVGSRLPSENQLCEQLGISRTTLREAIGHLERQGVVARMQGVGTFVSMPLRNSIRGGLDELISLKMLTQKLDFNYERLLWSVSEAFADESVALALLVKPGSIVLRTQMVIGLESHVYAYLDSYLHNSLSSQEKLSAYQEGSLLDYLLEVEGCEISHTYSQIHAAVVDDELSQFFSKPIGSPLLHLVETYKTKEGKPIVHTFNYFDTDIMNFTIIRRVVPFSEINRRTSHEEA